MKKLQLNNLLTKSKLASLLALFIVCISVGCVRVVRLDAPDYKPTYDNANLIFQTDTLSKSRWYLLTSYNLRLVVFQDKANEPGKFQYFGTVVLTSEENTKNIPIPSERDIYLQAEYSDYVVGLMSMCKTATCLRPKTGATYKLIFQQDSKSCMVSLSNAEGLGPVDSPCSSRCKDQKDKNEDNKEENTY